MPAPRVPFRIAPMLATLVDAPFHRAGWVYEEKYDGIRIIAYKEGARVSLITRNMKDRTRDFGEVARTIARLPAPTLALDGEVVVFDPSDVSHFQLLQRHGLGEAPVVFAVFDCLYAHGRDLRARPLTERRLALEAEVPESETFRLARRLADDGFAAFAEARRLALEGLVAKDLQSRYEAGKRSRAWLKVKVRAEDEFVIGGYTAPEGSRTHFGALLVGAWSDAGAGARLRYAGKVGTGFTGRTLDDLMRRMRPLVQPASPFSDHTRERGVTWVAPQLVAQLAFTELTGDGKLRHPAFLGLRDDKPAREVLWPGPRQAT